MSYLYKKTGKLFYFNYFLSFLKLIKHITESLAAFHLFVLILTCIFLMSTLSCSVQSRESFINGKMPERIVSLAPNITEILFSLDAGDQIVGVTSFCNYPPEASSKRKIGGFTNPNLELIASLKPDLIIATPNVGNREAILNIKRVVNAEVLLLKAENMPDFYKMIEKIGTAIHKEEKALNLIKGLQSQFQSIQKITASLGRKKVLLSLSINPIISATSKSYPGILATTAGADLIPVLPESQVQINPYPIINLEEIINLNPEIIIQTTMDPIEEAEEIHLKKFWEQWSSLTAVQRRSVHVISGDIILRPSPRAADGVKLLCNLIHGESPIADDKK